MIKKAKTTHLSGSGLTNVLVLEASIGVQWCCCLPHGISLRRQQDLFREKPRSVFSARRRGGINEKANHAEGGK